MLYGSIYKCALGNIFIVVKDNKLIGLFFEGQKYFMQNIDGEINYSSDNFMILKTKEWLDNYFEGKMPDVHEIEFDLIGSDFRKCVWEILLEIPYGCVVTYKDVADKVASILGLKSMSAQAVGGAIGHNPISIIIPCHRVVGSGGNLTGYAGGIERKLFLLNHEKVDVKNYMRNIC